MGAFSFLKRDNSAGLSDREKYHTPQGPLWFSYKGGRAVRPAEPAGEVKTKKYTG